MVEGSPKVFIFSKDLSLFFRFFSVVGFAILK